MNKDLIQGILFLLVIILIPIGVYSYIKMSDIKKDNCVAKNGYVVEDYLGFYDYCVIKGDKK